MLLVPVPLFSKNDTVEAFLFRYHAAGDTARKKDSYKSPLLEALEKGGGLTAFSGGKPLFVPVSGAMLLSDLDRQCTQRSDKIVFLLEDEVPIKGPHLSSMTYLRGLGYRFALMGYPHRDEPDTLLGICDYLILRDEIRYHTDRKTILRGYTARHKHLNYIAYNIDTPDQFNSVAGDGVNYFEGWFHQSPATVVGSSKMTPLKTNLVRLLNNVRDADFEFATIADTVQRDPALSLSLMRFVNSPYIGTPHKISTIQHAVVLLGQQEVRKWVTAAVFRSLGTDQPGELTRLSLVRAKLSESLADAFGMRDEAQGLFLMGLFSLLNLALETTMEETLKLVSVSDDIAEALVSGSGRYYPVLELIKSYENADWTAVLTQTDQHKINAKYLYDAYVKAVAWYNELVSDKVRPSYRKD